MRVASRINFKTSNKTACVSASRECCALRGNGWNRKHATVNYVFNYVPNFLYLYHVEVMKEMIKRKPDSTIDRTWFEDSYRGKNCERLYCAPYCHEFTRYSDENIYSEHNEEYMKECLENLKRKGIIIK